MLTEYLAGHMVLLLRVLLVGGCVPVIVIWRGSRSYQPGVQATGQWWPCTRATGQPARASAAQPRVADSDCDLGEQNVIEMVTCVRLCLDCADVCKATAAVLSRQAEFHADAGPAEPVDRLAVAAVGVLALTQQRSGTRFDAECPFGLAVICPRRELLEDTSLTVGEDSRDEPPQLGIEV